jgi:four helix bundle protein
MEDENNLINKSKKFALEIINVCNNLKSNNVLISQLLRSGTSIGANIHEANFAYSKADFISKLHIALKECYETEYWLSLFMEAKILNQEAKLLLASCVEIKKILIASCKTAKG